MIYTDANGRPIDPPEPPAPGAPIDDVIAWMRARAAWRDRIADMANAAFDKAFRAAVQNDDGHG